MKLKIFTDLSLLSLNTPVDLLIPFVGFFDEKDEVGTVTYGRFDDYYEKGKEFIELTSIEDCDICLLPIYWDVCNRIVNFKEAIAPFLEKITLSGKRIIIFASYDIPDIDIPVPNAIIFNSAISKSKQNNNVFSWPHFFEDYLKKYSDGIVHIREKGKIPKVGFCGYAPPINLKFSKQKIFSACKLILNYSGILQKFPKKIAHTYRTRAIIALVHSKKIETNFKIKSNFGFDPQGRLNGGEILESHKDFRKNFVQNILNSDYTLCIRGIGNNSVRFFETLCCGRIPVFVDTDSVLPFDHIIDWKKLCVWVAEKDIDKVGEIVSEFHTKISDEDFKKLQQTLRSIWEEYLSPVGFFKHIYLFNK